MSKSCDDLYKIGPALFKPGDRVEVNRNGTWMPGTISGYPCVGHTEIVYYVYFHGETWSQNCSNGLFPESRIRPLIETTTAVFKVGDRVKAPCSTSKDDSDTITMEHLPATIIDIREGLYELRFDHDQFVRYSLGSQLYALDAVTPVVTWRDGRIIKP